MCEFALYVKALIKRQQGACSPGSGGERCCQGLTAWACSHWLRARQLCVLQQPSLLLRKTCRRRHPRLPGPVPAGHRPQPPQRGQPQAGGCGGPGLLPLRASCLRSTGRFLRPVLVYLPMQARRPPPPPLPTPPPPLHTISTRGAGGAVAGAAGQAQGRHRHVRGGAADHGARLGDHAQQGHVPGAPAAVREVGGSAPGKGRV